MGKEAKSTPVSRLPTLGILSGFHFLQLIPQDCRLLVVFDEDGLSQILAQLLFEGFRLGGGEVLHQIKQGFFFGAEFKVLGIAILLPEGANFLQRGFDDFTGLFEIVLGSKLSGRGFGPGSEYLRVKLLELPCEFGTFGTASNEIDDLKVVFGIADNPGIVLKGEKGDVAVVVLDALLLK